jgi:hypothetical protein
MCTQGVDSSSIGSIGALESFDDPNMPIESHINWKKEEKKEMRMFLRMRCISPRDVIADGHIDSFGNIGFMKENFGSFGCDDS